jgi:alpha-amylase
MGGRTSRGSSLAVLLAAAAPGWACSSGGGPWRPGQTLTVDVGSVFPAGTVLREQYGGGTATVDANGKVTIQPDAAGGVALLERDGASPTPFTWADSTVYFAMTDRFANGDPTNDGSYGRAKDGAQEVGTWHGGDWKGLTSKLDYIASLGATAVWISPIVEQVHGWVGGGSGDFKHYGYHGYWALDFTLPDANFGTEADLQEMIDQAHLRGLRVLADVVLNHPGYATGDDLLAYLPAVFKDGTGNTFKSFAPYDSRGWGAWNDLVDYNSASWTSWWSPTWIRAGFPGFQTGGTDDLTRQLAYLPDFITEGTVSAGVPAFFGLKPGTGFTTDLGLTVRQYLVEWHAGWVARLGLDGFRCDTAKNVELASWAALKTAGVQALRAWKAANPSKKLDDSDFWMVGEVFPHGVSKDDYFTTGGFDALLNFTFQPALTALLEKRGSLAAGADDLDALYAGYAAAISADPGFDVLSYLSSHDTELFFAAVGQDGAKQRQAGTALLLAPGAAQIFYGDESGRQLGPSGSDPLQGTRSDMNWSTTDQGILAHWQKLGQFRRKHAAIGAGSHQRLASPAGTYAFARTLSGPGLDDAVVLVVTPTN